MPMAAEELWVPDKTNDDTVNLECLCFCVCVHTTCLRNRLYSPLETKINLFYIQRFSLCRAVNIFYLGYKDQSINAT
jgi:hypothetical protein